MGNYRICSIAIAAAVLLASSAHAEMKTVDLTYIVDHPAIDAARKGIVDALAEAGFRDGQTMRLEVQSAQGNGATQTQIAKKFAGDGPSLIIAISTPSAQACQAATPTVPIVFSAVTHPVGAQPLPSLHPPPPNITATSHQQPHGAA